MNEHWIIHKSKANERMIEFLESEIYPKDREYFSVNIIDKVINIIKEEFNDGNQNK